VIFLDHRVTEQISTRRMRVVKYRGASHIADEIPFLIDERGFSVLPSSSMKLDHKVSSERISSGVKDLDGMLEGKGFYRGSSVLVSGTAGSGKSTLAAHFAQQTCRGGERCLYVAFEESAAQAMRNMRSIGVDLATQVRKGLLRFEAWRPTQSGLEMHLLQIHKLIEEHKPAAVVIDPLTSLMVGNTDQLHSMLMRLIDFLKTRQITGFFIALTSGRNKEIEETEVGISSLIDTWIFTRDVELNGERNRCIHVLKSRGMANSNQVREFLMSKDGIRLLPVYVGSGAVLTGSARLSQEARERAENVLRQQTKEEQQRFLDGKRKALEAQIEAMRSDFAQEEARVALVAQQEERRERDLSQDVLEMVSLRGGVRRGRAAGRNGRVRDEHES
jgi:circadian clock protein KaiC